MRQTEESIEYARVLQSTSLAQLICLLMLVFLPMIGHTYGGWTTVTITPYETAVYRLAQVTQYGACMPSYISVSDYGELVTDNQIKLQGHRITPPSLWPYEDYWAMDTTWLSFSCFQLSTLHAMPFGPACPDPPDKLAWDQIYRYTATIWAGWQYVSDTVDVTITDEYLLGDDLQQMIEETL